MRTIRQCISRACNTGGHVAAMLGIAALAMAACGNADAQDNYPNKPIRMIVGFAAGGPTDILARVLGAGMAKVVGEQVYIENRTGAGGNLATEASPTATPPR
jgi:tripartite-type tricarboxylate transporter receptor subunit TctC